MKFAGYLPDSTDIFYYKHQMEKLVIIVLNMLDQLYCLAKNVVFLTKK